MKKKILSLFLAASMIVGLAACGGKGSGDSAKKSGSDASSNGTLVACVTGFENKFSPFFSQNVDDTTVQEMTQIQMLYVDRESSPILNGMSDEGETIPFNGTDYTYKTPANIEVVENEDGSVDYNITMRDDLVQNKMVTNLLSSLVYICKTWDGKLKKFAS